MRGQRLGGWLVAGSVVGALAVSGASVAASATTLKLKADPGGDIKFTKKKLSASAGSVTIKMANPSSSGSPHGIAITGHGIKKVGKTVNPGKTSKVTAKLKAGKYTFYCPVPGHRALGMKGTLTIK
jgi:uncharacterized cupredoxin-like copper-binding protein